MISDAEDGSIVEEEPIDADDACSDFEFDEATMYGVATLFLLVLLAVFAAVTISSAGCC